MRYDQACHITNCLCKDFTTPKTVKFITIVEDIKTKQQFKNMVLKTEIQQFLESEIDQTKILDMTKLKEQQRYKYYQITINNINKYKFVTLMSTTNSETFKIEQNQNIFQTVVPDCQQITLIFQQQEEKSLIIPLKLEIGCNMCNDMKIMIQRMQIGKQFLKQDILYIPIQFLFAIQTKFIGTLYIILISKTKQQILKQGEVTNEDILEFNFDEFLMEVTIDEYDYLLVTLNFKYKQDQLQGENTQNPLLFKPQTLGINQDQYSLFTVIDKKKVDKQQFIQNQTWFYGKLDQQQVYKAQLRQEVPLFIQQQIDLKLDIDVKKLYNQINQLDSLYQNQDICQQLDKLFLYLTHFYQIYQSQTEKNKYVKQLLDSKQINLKNLLYQEFICNNQQLSLSEVKIINKVGRLYQLFIQQLLKEDRVQQYIVENQYSFSFDEVIYLYEYLDKTFIFKKSKLEKQLNDIEQKQKILNKYYQIYQYNKDKQPKKEVQQIFQDYKKQLTQSKKLLTLDNVFTISQYLQLLNKDDFAFLSRFTNRLFKYLEQIYDYQEINRYKILYSVKNFWIQLNSKQKKQQKIQSYKFQVKINSLNIQLQEAFYLFFVQFPDEYLTHQTMIQFVFKNQLIQNTYSQNEVNFLLKLLQNRIFYVNPIFEFINRLDTQIFRITYFDNIAVINNIKQTNIENYVEKLCILFADTNNPGYLDLMDQIDEKFQILTPDILQLTMQHIMYKPNRLANLIKILMNRQTKSQITKQLMKACAEFYNSFVHVNKLQFDANTLINPENIIVVQQFIDLLIKYNLTPVHYYLDCLIISYIKNKQKALAISTIQKKIQLIQNDQPDIFFLILQVMQYRQQCIQQNNYTYYPDEKQYCSFQQSREFIKLLKNDQDSWQTYLFKVDINSISQFLQLENQSLDTFEQWLESQMQIISDNIIQAHCGKNPSDLSIIDKFKTDSICQELPFVIQYFQDQRIQFNINNAIINENLLLSTTISGNQIKFDDLIYNQYGFQYLHILLLKQIIFQLTQFDQLQTLQNEVNIIQKIDQSQFTDLFKCFFPSYRPYFNIQQLIESYQIPDPVFIISRLVQLQKSPNGYIKQGLYIQNISSNLVNEQILFNSIVILNQYIIPTVNSDDKYIIILNQQFQYEFKEFQIVEQYRIQQLKTEKEINSLSVVLFSQIIKKCNQGELLYSQGLIQVLALQETYLATQNKQLLDNIKQNLYNRCQDQKIKQLTQKILDFSDNQIQITSDTDESEELIDFSSNEQSSLSQQILELEYFVDGKGKIRKPKQKLVWVYQDEQLCYYEEGKTEDEWEAVEMVQRNGDWCYKIKVGGNKSEFGYYKYELFKANNKLRKEKDQ